MNLYLPVNFSFVFVSIFQIFYNEQVLLLFYKLICKDMFYCIKFKQVKGMKPRYNKHFCDRNVLYPHCPINTVFLSLPFPLSLSFFPYTHTYTNISIYEIALLKCNSHTMVGKFEGCNRRYSAFLN